MIVIDSSFWLELFYGTNSGKIIKNNKDYLNANFILPTIITLEVYKKLLKETDEYSALLYTTQMKEGKVVGLDFDLSLRSAEIGKKYKLPLADSIIYATALEYDATLYTLDKHFEGLANVKFYEK